MLHGLGGGAEGWWKGFATAVRAKRAYSRDNLDAVKWVFPNAPSRPITLRHGLAEPAWYDMKTIPKYDVTKMWHDRKGILESAQHVKEVIQQLVREGIAPQRIVVGGFSQGGAIALTTTLHAAGVPLGGCFALSSYLPMAYDMYVGNLEVLPSALEVPFYLAHGTDDAVLPYSFAVKTRQELDTLGAKFVKMDTIEGLGHDLSDEELGLLAGFIANVIASHPIEKGVGKREKEVEEVAAGGRGGGGGGGGGGGTERSQSRSRSRSRSERSRSRERAEPEPERSLPRALRGGEEKGPPSPAARKETEPASGGRRTRRGGGEGRAGSVPRDEEETKRRRGGPRNSLDSLAPTTEARSYKNDKRASVAIRQAPPPPARASPSVSSPLLSSPSRALLLLPLPTPPPRTPS
jgi:lysophospholipase-2